MEAQAIECPPQEMQERRKLVSMWILLSVVSLAIIAFSPPYDLSKQSTVMVKAETVINIQSARKTYKVWPKDQNDKTFGFGEQGKLENPPIEFTFLGSGLDKKDKNIELATYDFVVRGQHTNVIIRFNPFEKPKKRFF